MERPQLLREETEVKKIASLRYKSLRADYLQNRKDFTLWQAGRRRMFFVCRLQPESKKPPLFLFNIACHIRWAFGNWLIGTTSKPILLDDYWRAKGWIETNRADSEMSRNTKAVSSGSAERKPAKALET